MYVRWKKRTRSRYHRPQDEQTLSAILVESVRIDGKPRQRIVSYLGCIGSKRLTFFYHQVDFWQSVDKHLGALDLSAETRRSIEAALEAVVKKPTPEAQAEALSYFAELTSSIKTGM